MMGYGGLDLDLDLDLDLNLNLDLDLDLRPEMAEGKEVVEMRTKRTRGEWGWGNFWNRYLPYPFSCLPFLPFLPSSSLLFPFPSLPSSSLPSSSLIVFPSFILQPFLHASPLPPQNSAPHMSCYAMPDEEQHGTAPVLRHWGFPR